MENFRYLSLSKFGKSLIFSFGTTALLISVSGIVCMCANKQMIWINTNPVIALMEKAHSFRDSIPGKMPCNSMCQGSSKTREYDSISTFVFASSPVPARVGLLDLCPKPLFERYPPVSVNELSPHPTRIVTAALECPVDVVLASGFQEEMEWVNTRRRVAMVTDAHTFGDWAIDKNPGVSVCADGSSPNLETAVTIPVSASSPNQAAIVVHSDFWPEPIDNILRGGNHSGIVAESVNS